MESTCEIRDCHFSGSDASALAIDSSEVTVLNCRFTGNRDNNAAAVYVANYLATSITQTFINCLFSGNAAADSGSGVIYTADDGNSLHDMEFINCTFAGNSTSAGAISQYGFGNFFLKNSILWNNSGSQTFEDTTVEDSLTAQDPNFVSPVIPANAPNSDGDYRLLSTSAAIDAGDNTGNTTAADLDGNIRILGGTIDLGPFESFPDPNSDLDRDGRTLLLETSLGTDPKVADAGNSRNLRITGLAGGQPTVTFGLGTTPLPGASYSLLRSATLEPDSFTTLYTYDFDLGTAIFTDSGLTVAIGTELVTITDTSPPPGGRAFYILQATRSE